MQHKFCLVVGFSHPPETYESNWVHLHQIGVNINNIWVVTTWLLSFIPKLFRVEKYLILVCSIPSLVGAWTTHLKNIRQLGSFLHLGGENKTYLKPPTWKFQPLRLVNFHQLETPKNSVFPLPKNMVRNPMSMFSRNQEVSITMDLSLLFLVAGRPSAVNGSTRGNPTCREAIRPPDGPVAGCQKPPYPFWTVRIHRALERSSFSDQTFIPYSWFIVLQLWWYHIISYPHISTGALNANIKII